MLKSNQSHLVKKSLTEWLSYLENIHNTEIDLGLQRISNVAKTLNISFPQSKVITVAGTNGKGTTCAFLENAFLAQHKTCAVYSSPHIETFNERLRINRNNIDDEALISAFEQIESARGNTSLTYYEYTTLAAFIILMTVQPDVILLEVGLGGRLDATNIIDADIAVITTIDFDHQGFLGNTREAIGYEKAGIMRANKPVVIGDQNPPNSLSEHANLIGAIPYFREKHFSIKEEESNLWQWSCQNDSTHKSIKGQHREYSNLCDCHIPRDNITTGLMVLELLVNDLSLSLSHDFVNNIIEHTRVPGRIEKFSGTLNRECDVILDVAHNPQAARYLAKQLSTMKYDNIYAVTAMLSDKDIENSLNPLTPCIEQWFLASLNVQRGCDAQTLARCIQTTPDKMNCFDNVSQAFKIAKDNAKTTDLILVFGSFYTVAEVRRMLVS